MRIDLSAIKQEVVIMTTSFGQECRNDASLRLRLGWYWQSFIHKATQKEKKALSCRLAELTTWERIGYANLSNMSANSASVFLILLRMFNGKFFTR